MIFSPLIFIITRWFTGFILLFVYNDFDFYSIHRKPELKSFYLVFPSSGTKNLQIPGLDTVSTRSCFSYCTFFSRSKNCRQRRLDLSHFSLSFQSSIHIRTEFRMCLDNSKTLLIISHGLWNGTCWAGTVFRWTNATQAKRIKLSSYSFCWLDTIHGQDLFVPGLSFPLKRRFFWKHLKTLQLNKLHQWNSIT